MPSAPRIAMLVRMRGRLFIGTALAACALAGGLIATSVFSASKEEPGPAPMQQVLADETNDLLAGIPQQGAVLGRRDAPVTLVEFADLQCPYCAQWSAVAFGDIVKDYVRPGKVRLVFGGLTFLGADSERGLRFALAAGRQRRLWNVVHLLYANQGAENSGWLNDDVLRRVGEATPGLQVDRAFDDASSLPVSNEVEAIGNQSSALGIQGTPSFAAGRTNGSLAPVPISSLDADGLRPHLNSLLASD
jgi:protein-disulfide isomerase